MPDDFAARLQALEDREAIRELIAQYGPLADSGNSIGVALLWRENGVYAVGEFGEAFGHDEIAALIDGTVHRGLMADGCAHLLGSPAIELDADLAVARCHSVVFRHEEGIWIASRVSANRWHLQRGPDGWRVLRRENALLTGNGAARELLCQPNGTRLPKAVPR